MLSLLLVAADRIAPWGLLLAVGADVFALFTLPFMLVNRRGRPMAGLAWAFAIVGIPVFGALTWWFIGPDRLQIPKQQRRSATRHVTERQGHLPEQPRADGPLALVDVLPETEFRGPFPPVRGNRVELLGSPDAFFAAVEDAIRGAEHCIHLEFFEWYVDPLGRRFRDLLIERARAGVRVRLLVDGLAAWRAWHRFMDPLRDAGGDVRPFLPPHLLHPALTLNFRTHRKLVMVDGEIGITGGLNMGSTYARDYMDVGVRLRGPVVRQLEEVFADDWYFITGEDLSVSSYPGQDREGEATCAVVASGPHMSYNPSYEAFFLAIVGARRRLWIATPFLVPDSAILTALRTAVYRGVDVRLVVEGKADVRTARLAAWSFYPALVEAGVRLYEYEAAIVHAKMLLVDDDVAAVGSVNVDTRSFRLSFESSCFVHDAVFGDDVARWFEARFGECREIDADAIARQSLTWKLGASIAQLLSPLL